MGEIIGIWVLASFCVLVGYMLGAVIGYNKAKEEKDEQHKSRRHKRSQ